MQETKLKVYPWGRCMRWLLWALSMTYDALSVVVPRVMSFIRILDLNESIVWIRFSEVMCPRPSVPSHGSLSPSHPEYVYGEVVTYTCDAGYRRNGDARRVCQLDNTWSGTTPTCTGKRIRSLSPGTPPPPPPPLLTWIDFDPSMDK